MPALVLALNPCVDVEWRVADVLWEEKNTLKSERRWAGGKGINVVRWLRFQGGSPRLLLPLGGATGDELRSELHGEGLAADVVPIQETTRANIIVTTNARRQMRFNPPGPKLSRREWNEVVKRAERILSVMAKATSVERRGSRASGRGQRGQGREGARPSTLDPRPFWRGPLLILSGSLPRGVPINAYARLIYLGRRLGARTLLDCDGPALAAAVSARPFLVKPNEHELAQWWRKPLRGERAVLRAALALSEATRGWVLVSRGAGRSLLVNAGAGELLFARPPRVKTTNTVGAGDALLAGVAWQIQAGGAPADWLRRGVATGTAATLEAPGRLPPASRIVRMMRGVTNGGSGSDE